MNVRKKVKEREKQNRVEQCIRDREERGKIKEGRVAGSNGHQRICDF